MKLLSTTCQFSFLETRDIYYFIENTCNQIPANYSQINNFARKDACIMKKQLLSILFILAFTISTFAQSAGGGDCSNLFLSEYVEGWGNNKAVEIYNPTANPIDLANYQLGRFSNGQTFPYVSALQGIVQPYDVIVLVLDKRNPNGVGLEEPVDPDLEAAGDLFLDPVYVFGTGAMYFNGNDGVALLTPSNTVIDIMGKIGEDPGFGWPDQNGAMWTQNQTLVRKPTVQQGDANGYDVFWPEMEWDSLEVNTFTSLGFHDCSCNVPPPCTTPSNVSYSGLNTSYSIADGPASLVGSPTGGVFFGAGVSGNDFNPAFAGIGTHSIVYTYVDGSGCIGSYGLCTTVDFNVGIEGTEISTTDGIDIYPNPSADRFYLSFDNIDGIVNYTVYDAMGKEVQNDAFVANGFAEKTINLAKLANGVYTLQLNTIKGSFTEKLVKE